VPGDDLVTTAQAAAELGISRRTLARYVEQGLVTPELTLPSGHHRWNVNDLRRQLRDLRRDRE
jgi:DNA-binding transcriptional MerR regulator